jgi:hypothetical protein
VNGHRIDIGSESLAYELPWLDPERSYQLVCRFYAPETDTLYQDVFLNDSLVATMTIAPFRTDTLVIALPREAYAETGRVRLKTTGPAFALIVLEGITVFESEPDSAQFRRSGAQSEVPEPAEGASLRLSGGNPSTSLPAIHYRITRPGMVKLGLFDVAGRQVGLLASGYHSAGDYALRILDFGFRISRLGGGVYICRLETSSGSAACKLVLVTR